MLGKFLPLQQIQVLLFGTFWIFLKNIFDPWLVAETADTTPFLKERDTFLRQSPVPSISTTTECEVKNNEPKQKKKKTVTILNDYLVLSIQIA